MGLKLYIKRGIKYILKEYKQPIIKVEVVQKEPLNLFKDKVYIITGGGSGLGFYMAKKLISEGAFVVITGRNEQKLKSAKKELGKNCNYKVFDIGETNKADFIMDSVFDQYKKVDGIINNAGISLHEWDFMKVDEEKFDSQFLTNLKGSYFFTQSYIRKMRKLKKNGNVIFISSERGSMCDDLPYGLTKASINSLVQSLSFRYYQEGIRVNGIAPGVTASEMTNIDKNADLYSNCNAGRFFVPEEVAELACFLLSDYSKCISGEVIHCNGGNHIKRGY